MEKQVNEIVDELVEKGSIISELDEFKSDVTNKLKRDTGLREILGFIANDIEEQTKQYLDLTNEFGINYISGISMCVYMPDYKDNGEYKYKILGGNRSRNSSEKIDENTLFDISGLTELYTLLLLFKLEELGFVDLDTKVCDINTSVQGLEDFTLNDLVRLHGDIVTDGNIAKTTSLMEAYNCLYSATLQSNSREKNTYKNFNSMIIADTICQVISREFGRNVSFEEIMDEFLIKPLGLKSTMFNPPLGNLSGNNGLGVHDPKARIFNGAMGHAGLFTNSDDLAKLSSKIFTVGYLNNKHLNRLGEYTFPELENSKNRGNLGLYLKHEYGYSKTFTPLEFSNGSYSHQGWTGCAAMFDPNNFIHHNILINAIYEDDDPIKVKANKAIGFMTEFENFQKSVTRNIMMMYVAKQYYNKYCGVKENIHQLTLVR